MRTKPDQGAPSLSMKWIVLHESAPTRELESLRLASLSSPEIHRILDSILRTFIAILEFSSSTPGDGLPVSSRSTMS